MLDESDASCVLECDEELEEFIKVMLVNSVGGVDPIKRCSNFDDEFDERNYPRVDWDAFGESVFDDSTGNPFGRWWVLALIVFFVILFVLFVVWLYG